MPASPVKNGTCLLSTHAAGRFTVLTHLRHGPGINAEDEQERTENSRGAQQICMKLSQQLELSPEQLHADGPAEEDSRVFVQLAFVNTSHSEKANKRLLAHQQLRVLPHLPMMLLTPPAASSTHHDVIDSTQVEQAP